MSELDDGVVKVPQTNCLACHTRLNRAGSVSEEGFRGPRAGDFTFCIRCAHVMVFNADLSLRELTAEEFVESKENLLLQVTLRHIRRVNHIVEHVKKAANAGNN